MTYPDSRREQIVANTVHDFTAPYLAVREARLHRLQQTLERSARTKVQPVPDEDIQILGDWCAGTGLVALAAGEVVNLATEIATSGENIAAQGLAKLGAGTFLLGVAIKWMGRN